MELTGTHDCPMHTTRAQLLLVRFLARCYDYPDHTFVRGLCEPDLWSRLEAAGEVLGSDAYQAIADLGASLGTEPRHPTLPPPDLAIEYTYLFVNATPHLPAPPYESAYSREGLLMGEAVSKVLRAYRNAGLTMRRDPGLLPDHLVTELEFMTFLIGQEVASQWEAPEWIPSWRAQQQQFLSEHLLRWIPTFLSRVTEHARRPFYVRVANLTASLLCSSERRLCPPEPLPGRIP